MRQELDEMQLDQINGGDALIDDRYLVVGFTTTGRMYNIKDKASADIIYRICADEIGKYRTTQEYDLACEALIAPYITGEYHRK